MELSKGVCFFCSNTKIIHGTKYNLLKKIKSLFDNSCINEEQLMLISPPNVCPMCYHKLNLLKSFNKEINSSKKNTGDGCLLCVVEKNVINVSTWNIFEKISSDFPALTNSSSPLVCTACIFYLDIRNSIKEKLLSVHPKLKVKSKSGWKFASDITNHSTPIVDKNMQKKIAKNRTEEEKLKSPIKLTFLRQGKDLKISKIGHEDPKLNQEVVIRLKAAELQKESTKIKFKGTEELGNKKRKNRNEVKTIEPVQRRLREKVNKQSLNEESVVEISSDSDEVTKETSKKKTYFKIKLNKKSKPKKIIAPKFDEPPKNEILNGFKILKIQLESIQMPVPNNSETNIIESEDTFDSLKRKSCEKKISESEEVDEKMRSDSDEDNIKNSVEKERFETNAEEEKMETEEINLNTTVDAEENFDIEETKEKEKLDTEVLEQNGYTEDSQENSDDHPEKSDSEIAEKSVETNADNNKASDLDVTEKLDTEDDNSKEKMEDSDSQLNETTVEDSGDSEKLEKINDPNGELLEDNLQMKDFENEEPQEKQTKGKDSDDFSEDNEERVDIEGVITNIEVDSDQDEQIETINSTLDSQEEDSVTQKRKREDDDSEINSPEKKKKKVTFSEDTVSSD